MPGKNTKFVNRKKELIKSGFKGFKNVSFDGTHNSSLNQRKHGGIPLFSSNEVAKRKKLYKLIKKSETKPGDKVVKQAKTKPYGKKKETRVVGDKLRRVSVNPVGRKVRPRVKTAPPQRVRDTIQPGKVLILLAGRYAGKRVICLKVLKSGLIVVTGPFKLNGVPVRRVNPAYVIATSTKVNLDNVKLPESLDDKLFDEEKKQLKAQNTDGDDVSKSTQSKKQRQKETLSEQRVKLQQEVDEQILPVVKGVAHLGSYLQTRFTLQGTYAHDLKF